jgi:hypothetical protein
MGSSELFVMDPNRITDMLAPGVALIATIPQS